jgi:Tfp pilus assembly major pilin PilA
MKNYSTALETIIAFLVLVVVAGFLIKVKYYQYLGDQQQIEIRQEK